MYYAKARQLAPIIVQNWIKQAQIAPQTGQQLLQVFSDPTIGQQFQMGLMTKFPNGVDDNTLMQLVSSALLQIMKNPPQPAPMMQQQQMYPGAYGMPGQQQMYPGAYQQPMMAAPIHPAPGVNLHGAMGGVYPDLEKSTPDPEATPATPVITTPPKERSTLLMSYLDAAHCTTVAQKLAVRVRDELLACRTTLLDIDRKVIDVNDQGIQRAIKFDNIKIFDAVEIDRYEELVTLQKAILTREDNVADYYRVMEVNKRTRADIPTADFIGGLHEFRQRYVTPSCPVFNFGFMDEVRIIEKLFSNIPSHQFATALKKELLRVVNEQLFRKLRLSTDPTAYVTVDSLAELEDILQQSDAFYQNLRACILLEPVMGLIVKKLEDMLRDSCGWKPIEEDLIYALSELSWRTIEKEGKLRSSQEYFEFEGAEKELTMAKLKECTLLVDVATVMVTNCAPSNLTYNPAGYFIPVYAGMLDIDIFKVSNTAHDLSHYDNPFDATIACMYLSGKLPDNLITIDSRGRTMEFAICPMLDGGGVLLV